MFEVGQLLQWRYGVIRLDKYSNGRWYFTTIWTWPEAWAQYFLNQTDALDESYMQKKYGTTYPDMPDYEDFGELTAKQKLELL